jgi:predicted transcriptional regulator
MVICPFCKEENIDGVDECEQCQQPLGFLSKPRASSKIEHSLIKDQVYMLGPRKPLAVDVATAVGTVLELMVSRAIGCVVVTEYDQMVGIFTERDALLRLNVDAASLSTRPVREFMTKGPDTVTCDAPIAFVLHKMDIGGFRHMPVMDAGKVVGVVSVRDILRYITEDLMSLSG